MSSATTSVRPPGIRRTATARSGNNQDSNHNATSNSPLLFEALKCLSTIEQRIILDMGPASHSSIDFFGEYWCKLFIADAITDLHKQNLKASETPLAWQKALSKSIKFNTLNHANLDIVFLWTLPNYLSPQNLKALIEFLLPHSDSHTRVHAYIYNTQMMPAVPSSYHIKRNQKVDIVLRSSNQKNCPLYHLAELHNCFKPFKVDHAVMLSSGVQEYLFTG